MPEKDQDKAVRSVSLHNDTFYQEIKEVKKSLRKSLILEQILGTSEAIQTLRQKLECISKCTVNVLITGETGTGKELAARAIHYLGNRAGKPFVPVNCGAIPENLFENELFGHVKGAFTDASFKQDGLVREAEGGTLFLDEIGAISPFIQVKLLRLLENKEYKVLGDSQPCKADLRIISATNQDLKTLITEDKFREDLFYRLNIVSIDVPPLRERKKDIPLLVGHFLKKYTEEYQKFIRSLSINCINRFMSHSWPGNIRELENMIQQLIVLAESETVKTSAIELPEYIWEQNQDLPASLKECKKEFVDSFEKSYLAHLLSKHDGSVASAALEAGMNRTAMWNLLKKHDISAKSFKSIKIKRKDVLKIPDFSGWGREFPARRIKNWGRRKTDK